MTIETRILSFKKDRKPEVMTHRPFVITEDYREIEFGSFEKENYVRMAPTVPILSTTLWWSGKNKLRVSTIARYPMGFWYGVTYETMIFSDLPYTNKWHQVFSPSKPAAIRAHLNMVRCLKKKMLQCHHRYEAPADVN